MAGGAFTGIVGHEAAIERLTGIVRRDRVAHAYLFAGPEAIGKRTVALRFARLLLCDNKGDDRCRDCADVDNGTHLHLTILQREEDKQEITIKQVRELLASLALKTTLPKPRVILVDDADRLSEEAMNALLKTLEEPPHRCVFLLVSASPSALLPTIISRCQTVHFAPITEDRVREHLEGLGKERSLAALTARLTRGSLGRALAEDEEIEGARERLEEALSHIHQHNLNPIVESITRIRDPKRSRREAVLLFDLLLVALRESLRSRLTGRKHDPDLLPESGEKLLSELSDEDLLQRIDTILEHQRYLDMYANVGLTVENALLRI